ncbi:hypothetical protein GCM10010252_77990 [Streptomyces aureoverticillatus]|nr:hypothetical protein GCM10010252_77990 [Streptomyces aureoverticillatus]
MDRNSVKKVSRLSNIGFRRLRKDENYDNAESERSVPMNFICDSGVG